MSRLFSVVFRALIMLYRGAISPLFSPICRYTPSCSEYGLKAIDKHGPFKGMWLTLKRLSTCHPWGGHGHDPVP
ncbi:MAG: membrane protein insertion efficiency factor YidD [Flavobacteriales bacterium]|nr:membrane protein insertion efficiency factor YidD [Flavobacteriales bacterium]MBL6872639.1 membrane protein insertion efficiency factor YidD [Flavobacteriales bacterium]